MEDIGTSKVKFIASQARTVNLYKNLRSKLLKCCANIYFNKRQHIVTARTQREISNRKRRQRNTFN